MHASGAEAKLPTPMAGLTLAALRRLSRDPWVTDASSTADVCYDVVLQETLPEGWALSSVQLPEGFIQHTYTKAADGQLIRRGGVRSDTTGEELLVPPPRGATSYVDLMSARGEGACVGTANRFVSHAWLLLFREVLAALEAGLLGAGALVKLSDGRLGNIVRYEGKGDAYLVLVDGEEELSAKAEELAPMHDAETETEIFLWFDICVINEHWPERFSKVFRDTFMEAVRDIGHTLLVLAPWVQPVVLSRSWCLWELNCTEQKECELTICLTNEQRQAFLATAFKSATDVQDAFGQIDSSQASAGSDADRDKIAAAIDAGVGFKALDGMIFARLRDWALTRSRRRRPKRRRRRGARWRRRRR